MDKPKNFPWTREGLLIEDTAEVHHVKSVTVRSDSQVLDTDLFGSGLATEWGNKAATPAHDPGSGNIYTMVNSSSSFSSLSLSSQLSKSVISIACYSNSCNVFWETRKEAKFRRTSLQHFWCQRTHKNKVLTPCTSDALKKHTPESLGPHLHWSD